MIPEILSYTIDYSTLDLDSHNHEEMWLGRDYFATREEAIHAATNWKDDFNHILHYRLHIQGPDINRLLPVYPRDFIKTWRDILNRGDESVPESYTQWVQMQEKWNQAQQEHDFLTAEDTGQED
jgi:hypothetical protein